MADRAHPTLLSRVLTGAGAAHTLAFSPDGRTLAVGNLFGQVVLWSVTDPAHPSQLGQPLIGPASPVVSVTFSPDGRTLAAGAAYEVLLWNVADPAHPTELGQPLTGPADNVNSVAFSPDGQTLAAGTSTAGGGDGVVWLWNLHRRLMAVAAGSGEGVLLWNATDPAHPTTLGQPLTGPAIDASSLAFSPDGRILAAGTDDDVWLWDLADPAHPIRLSQPLTGPGSSVNSVAFSPDGQTLAAGTGDGDVWLWNLDVDKAIQRVCVVVGSLTRAQWDQYVSSELPYDPPCAHPGSYGLLDH